MNTPTEGVSVPDNSWDEKVARGRALVSEINDRKWELGDLANEVCPAAHGVHDGDLLGKFADQIGLSREAIKKYRQVASAWPEGTRVPSQTWTTHRLLHGKPDRFEIIKERTWTYNSLNERLGWLPNPSRVNKDTGEILDKTEAREFIRKAIASSHELAGTADQALEDRARRFRENRPAPTERRDNAHDDAMHLVWLLRKAHKALAEAVEYGQNIRGAGADAMVTGVNAEVAWIRAACDVLEAGANSGSLDEQIEAFLETEAGR
jgi:hypothetical protein